MTHVGFRSHVKIRYSIISYTDVYPRMELTTNAKQDILYSAMIELISSYNKQ